MPTLPTRPTPTTEPQPQPHEVRRWAESFGDDPDRYDRTRPRYPQELVDRIVAASPGPAILDVGTGTGIVARQLQAAFCTVIGVDVDARMAEHARRHGLAVEVAAFEGWDPAGRTFDAVVAGQTWHWIDPVAGAAKSAQVLRPGGRLVPFWNVFVPPPAMAAAFSAVHRRVVPDLLDPWARPTLESYDRVLEAVVDGIRSAGAFGEPERWRVDWARTYTSDEWLDQVPSFGGHAELSPDQMADLLAGMAAAIDEVGGRFTMPYAAVAIAVARRAR